ncbi:mechanosensitive ion channel family protein [Pseudanabaena sp. PCC 6802]|uniref:mechanosensitive ion channel family protein n=1 Tax=Pseudanabaena sp. PCC 6802 TaxID=118173 RepID=UPI00034546B7|nr:mechanosensitive ion channel family protein [Pseudanabaena sp. PCC 6802]
MQYKSDNWGNSSKRRTKHRKCYKFWLVGGAIALSTCVSMPSSAQIPPTFNWDVFKFAASPKNSDPNAQIASGWVWLDGRPLFQVSAPKDTLAVRIDNIQDNLNSVLASYLRQETAPETIEVQVKQSSGLTALYVKPSNASEIYLMSVTEYDTKVHGVTVDILARNISQTVRRALMNAKQERQPQALLVQGGLAAGTVVAVILLSWGVRRWRRHVQASVQPIAVGGAIDGATSDAANIAANDLPEDEGIGREIATQIKVRQKNTLKEIQIRLLQGLQVGIWTCGTLVMLYLSPYTRGWLVLLAITLEIPVKLGLAIFGTYLAVRLSYALVDRFTSTLAQTTLLSTAEDSQRLQLRLSTISGVTKSITTVAGLGIGIFTGLAILGVDIGPLLAGAGLVGVAISFASQSVIKDTINGFFILLEDQYAIGDSIAVSGYSGLVENINLRITQLRDADGRLITIPNSEVKIVANLSSRWSRANLSIPVAYNADLDRAIALIREVAANMVEDNKWREKILETPEVLGVDDFASNGLTVRVWMKTQPSLQGPVAREFRRRVKMTFDRAGIALPTTG